MTDEEIRDEIKRRKEAFRREQAALPFAEKVRIAFELYKRRVTIKNAVPCEETRLLPPSSRPK